MFIDKIKTFFNSGHPRSIKAKKHILYSFVLKGLSIIINLAYVPLLLDYIGTEEYGIWLTLTSIVTWFTFFDVGLGNGLRNNFAIAIAKGEHSLAKTYVSTTYAILSIIFVSLIFLFVIIANFVDWSLVYNTHNVDKNILLNLTVIVFIFFFLRFIFQTIGVILMADQKPSINSSFNIISNIICYIIIYILKISTESSLPLLGFILSGVPVFVFLFASFYYFNKNYKLYKPSLKYVDFKQSKSLFSLGFKFFLIQISGIVMYSSTNFLIAQFTSPEDVTVYNIAYKIFTISIMVYSIVLTPMWSATTEAYALNDFKWIRNFVNKMQKIGFILVLTTIILLFLSDYVYKFWIGDRIIIPFRVSLLVAMGSIMYVLTGVYIQFQNGIGKIKLTIYWVIAQCILFIPLAYLFAITLKLGLVGILLSAIIIEIPAKYIQIVQYYKIINNKATGLWNK